MSSRLDVIILGQAHNGCYYPFAPRESTPTLLDPAEGYSVLGLSNEQFQHSFKSVSIIQMHEFSYSGFCTLKSQTQKNITPLDKCPLKDSHISVRTFKLE